MTEQTPLQRIVRTLHSSAGLRSAAYLGSMVGVELISQRLPRDAHHPFLQNIHPYAFPGVILITTAFTQLRPADRAAWMQPPTRQNRIELAQGLAIGTTACLATLGVAALKGWVAAPGWGWERGPGPLQVSAAVGWTIANTVLVVVNEEIIFRGYGFDTLEDALGTPGAIAISVPLFALNHGPGWKRFLGFSMAGLLLAFLRLGTGNLWLAGGFHLAWNLVQQALFGPPDGPPSIRPLQLHGPPAWVGRPGHPDPGWLQILAFTLLAALAGVWLRQRRAVERSDGYRHPPA